MTNSDSKTEQDESLKGKQKVTGKENSNCHNFLLDGQNHIYKRRFYHKLKTPLQVRIEEIFRESENASRQE